MYLKRIFVILMAVCCIAAGHASQTSDDHRISVFGSSVASGSVAENQQGYWYMLQQCLDDRGWEVSSCSRGGDRTSRILDRFDDLISQEPDYVLIGLSLANEGIRDGNHNRKEEVYRQYKWGMQAIIELLRSKGITPVVGLCYPHGEYTPEEYDYVKNMNLLINSWDVPSANFLGAIEDGHGRWVEGFVNDPGHPNTLGHREMYYAIVPSLFDALEVGKGIPQKASGDGFLTLGEKKHSAVSFKAADPIHSWSNVFSIRTKKDGLLSTISGKDAKAMVSVTNGRITYTSNKGENLTSEVAANDGKWHQVAVSHRYAKQETLLFIDGNYAGSVQEQLEPVEFLLGDFNSSPADFKEWFVYRAALNDLETQALAQGQMVQASLEIYAPLQDSKCKNGKVLENRAQSMSEAIYTIAR